jgi:hypothetical protein
VRAVLVCVCVWGHDECVEQNDLWCNIIIIKAAAAHSFDGANKRCAIFIAMLSATEICV